MNLGKAFSFAFEDPDWIKKLLIGALITLIPIIGGIVVLGWGLEITRRVIHKESPLLPDWSDFGGYLVKGLQAFVIAFVYMLPIILVSVCSQSATALVGQGDIDQTVVTAITVVSACLSCVVALYGVLMSFVLPAAFANFVASGQLGAGFRFGEIIGLVRAAPVAYLLVLVGAFVASIIASLGVILCIVGMFFTYVYAATINAHLWGQAYNEASAARGLQTTY